MTGKTTAAIIAAIILTVVIPSAPATNRDSSSEQPIQFKETSLPPETDAATFLINLENELICLTEFDSSGKELSRKTIEYINIYSLYPAQLEQLRTGAVFDSREAAAEFIQDLGS